MEAISAGLGRTQVPVLGNALPGQELLLPSTPLQCPQSGCLLEKRHLEAAEVAEHLCLAPFKVFIVANHSFAAGAIK